MPGSGTGEVEKIAFWKTYWPSKGVKVACTYHNWLGLETKVGPEGIHCEGSPIQTWRETSDVAR